jgi:type IV pilus assembly protein PilN
MYQALVRKVMDSLSRFSVQQEDVVGVDITPGYVRVAQLEKTDNDWLLTNLGYKYVEVTDAEGGVTKASSDAYIERIKAAISGAKITTTNAAVSIPVTSAIVKVVNLPLMTDEELQAAIDTDSLWENVVQLTDALDEYSIFWQIISRNSNENTMDLLFVASKLSDINFYLDLVSKAGLNPVIVDVRCFALRNALEAQKGIDLKGKTIALLEIGPHENYFLILKDDSPFISGIFVSDPDRKALGDPALDLEQCQKLTDRIAMQVKQTIGTYQSKFGGLPIDEILLVSSMPTIDQAIRCLSQSLAPLRLKLFNSYQGITVPKNIEEKLSAEPNTSLFTASFGLATRKLDVFGYYAYVTGVNNINLLPNRDQVKNVEKAKFLGKLGLIAASAIVGLIIAATFFIQATEGDELNSAVSEYFELESKRNDLQMNVDNVRLKQQELAGLLDASKGLVSNQQVMYDILTQLNLAIPEGVWLESIDYKGAQEIMLGGKSVSDQNILEFIEKLNGAHHVARASLNTMTVTTQAGREIKKFSLTIVLEKLEKNSDSAKGGQ